MKNYPQHISESLFANQIKNQKRDTTSFVLFPIRIETRFMQMTLPQVKERHRVLDAFMQMNVVINHTLRIGKTDISPEERKRFAQELNQLTNTMGYLDGIYREDKVLLDRLVAKIGICVDQIVAHLPKDGREAARKSLQDIYDNMKVYAAGIPTINARKADKATRFLDEYEKVVNRIKSLSMLKTTPYSGYHHENPKTGNLNLIRHYEKHLGECLDFINNMKDRLSKLPSMTAEQRARFTRYTKLLLTGEETKKLDTSGKDPINIMTTQGYLHYALLMARLVQFHFSKEVWKDNMDRLVSEHQQAFVTIWNALWRTYYDCRQAIRKKPFTTVRYTHLLYTALSMKLDYVSEHSRGAGYTFNTDKLRKMADVAYFDYQKAKPFAATLLREINALPCSGSPVDVARIEKYTADASRLAAAKEEESRKSYCLCVRIFPDEIGINKFVKTLTLQEKYDGMSFWLRFKMAQRANDEILMKAAWSLLCDRYAPYRAGWIARCLRPEDGLYSRFNDLFGAEAIRQVAQQQMDFINDKVAQYLPDPAYARSSKVAPFFPALRDVDRDPNDFGKPVSPVLPDRFVFEGKVKAKGRKAYTIVKYGRRVFPDLQVALDFNENLDLDPFVVNESTGALTVNSGIRWMTSYGMAEKMGMAITIPLGDLKGLNFNFESVYVMGIKNGTKAEARDIIDDTFLSHFYSEEGIDLLKIGTPTNILDDKAADASYDTSFEALSDLHYRRDVLAPPSTHVFGGDAERLATVLGLGRFNVNESAFNRVAHSDNTEIQKSVSANARLARALFPSSDRDPRRHVLLEQRKVIGFKGRAFNFISNDISSRGLYPPIRIGAQPYGIVPVTDFANFLPKDGNLYQLTKLLLWLTEKWNKIAEDSVIHEANMNKDNNPVQNYIEMIGCTPTSTSFYARDYIKNPDLLDPVYFRSDKGALNSVKDADDFLTEILALPRNHGKSIGSTLRSLMKKFDRLPIEKEIDLSKGRDPYLKEIEGNPWGDLPGKLRDLVSSEQEQRQLVAEFFDLFAYRLDAWTVGLLNYTIRKRIDENLHGVRIGAFGWVFNLRPDKKEAKSEEYILAPSITHAITGAVLRSSYVKSSTNTSDPSRGRDTRLCINLSSLRVREALRIIRGLQNGLSVGAILGSDLERYLHDSWKTIKVEMDAFIYPLRQMYPLVADVIKADDNSKTGNQTTIINGESLIYDLRNRIFNNQSDQLVDLYEASKKKFNRQLQGFLDAIGCSDEHKLNKLFLQIQRMEDSYDALRDVVMSESVYKLAEGNRVAVDALMNCLQQGRNIPLPDVVEIPMHSAHIEQRVIAALNPKASAPADERSVLKAAEPAVDAWIDSMLSGHGRIQAGFMKGNQVEVCPLSISASDLVYLSGNGASFHKFLEWTYAREHGFAWIPTLAPALCGDSQTLSLNEAELALDSLRDVLTDARILKADDLVMESANPDSHYDLTELKTRLEKLHGTLSATGKKMAAFIERHSLADASAAASLLGREDLMTAAGYLLDCYASGIACALDGLDSALFPQESITADPQAYLASVEAQATFRKAFVSVYGILCDRLSHVDLKQLAAEKSATKYIEAAQNLLLKSFKMVPRLDFPKPGFSQFSLDEEFIYDWIADAAKVRKPVFGLHTLRMFARLHDYEEPEYKVMQLPGDAKRWIGDGTGDIDESMIDEAKSYVVVNSGYMYQTDQTVAGLVLDSWVERIPYKTQTAALAFSYDQPDAEAPHAILVAVAPNFSGKNKRYSGHHVSEHWSPMDFVRSIKCSMHLVKTRAVEPDHLYKDKFASAFFPVLNVNYDKK